MTVDSSKSPSAYKFSGKISGQDVTFEYQKGQALKVGYTGDISLADLLKTVGVTDTQGSALLTGSITAPSLTVDSSKSPSAYKFSGKISGQDVTFEYQKGQELKVAYTGDVSLADLLKKVGISVDSKIAILNQSISGASLTISNFSSTNTSYKLTGNISQKPIVLDFSKEQIKITYEGETSLVDIFKGVPDVETIAAKLSVPITNPSFGIGKLDTPNKTYEISGIANFNNGNNGLAEFINKKLGIQQLNLTTKVDSNGASLKGKFETDISLFGDKNSQTDFSATLTGAALGLAVDKKAKPSFGIEGNILLKNYDPFQKNEPPLTLVGGLNLDPTSLTASFQLGSNTPWKDPFGLRNSELRNLSFQLGGTYVAPYIDNIGLKADLKVGGLDVNSALFIAPKAPDKFGMELTVYQPIGLVDIWSVPLSVAGVDNSGFVGKTKNFLKDVLDVTIVSIDGPDAGTELDPLIKFAPVETTFANTTITQGIAVNGKVNAWGKEATLNLAANPFSSAPSLSGSLKIPEIDLGILKLTGGNDSTLDVDLKLNSKEQSLKADAGLEIFGKKVANFDLSLSKDEIKLKNFQLGWSNVLAIQLNDFTLNTSKLSGSASGGIKLFGMDIASAKFSLNNGNLSISGKLGVSVKGYNFGIDVGFTLGKENRIRMDVDFLNKRYNLVNLGVDPFVNEFNSLGSLTTQLGNIVLGGLGDAANYAKNLLNEGLSGVSKVNTIVVGAASNVLKSAKNVFSRIFNGPLADATVFIDTNGNFQPDEGELQTTTDNNGEYNFDESKIAALDVNGDGEVDSKEGQIVGIGGIDTTTGLPATLPLISQVGSATEATTTTPLTTLQAVLSSQGIAAEQVETLLEKISGLSLASLSQPLDNFDPYAAIGKDDTTGINIASGHIKVMNLLLNGTAFLKAAKYQESDAEIQVIVALGEVLQKVDTFDLSKGDDLQKLFTQLTEKHNLSIASEAVKAVSEFVAQSNHLVDDLVGKALTRSVSDVLPSISPIKKAVYSTLPEVTQQLIEGKITAQESQTKLQELLKADTFLVQYALNEKRTVKVTASPTITEGDSNSQGQFTIALGEAAPAQGLKILYTLSGTATLGQDYSSNGGQFGEINIAPGETEAVIDLSVLDDTLPEKPEALTLNLKYVGTGYALDPVYQTAVQQIADNDQQNSANSQNGMRQTGTSGNDTLTGAEGDDNLSGKEGNDVLQGLAGNDQLTGGAGSDTVLGGEGNDKLEGNFSADILQGNAGDDVMAGGAENDTLEGNEGNDQLQGNAGHDQLKGNTGNDLLEGGLGNDTLEGNEENDWLVGDAGQDILTGGAGVDLLNGGDSADVFYFNAPSDGGDLILDFDPIQGDKIQISATGFNTKSLADFSVLAGTLEFKGQEIALIQNNGQTYNNFPNLGEILEIVDAPTGQPAEAAAAAEVPTQTTPSVVNPDLVKNPEKTILDDIIKRGQIKLGTSSSGSEFDFEFVRTLAAALFGDATKVERVTTTFAEAFEQVADGNVDIAAQRSTHYLGPDAEDNIDFSPIYFYDYQAVVVRKDSGIENALDLQDRTIGIEGSNSLDDLQNHLSPEGVKFTPKLFDTLEEVVAAYDRGEIDAYATDRALILERLADPENHRLLDVEFSKEPIALALPQNDSQWADVVRWVNYVPIQAEEFGISSENIDEIIAANTDKNPNNDSSPAIRRFLGLEGDLGGSLGLPKDFAVNVIKQVGNYAEIYDRHFPGVERDRNLLWNEGGLLYSPPFSGTKVDATLIDNDDRNLLAEVVQRGTLKLGLPGNNPGFAVKQANGEYVGFDVDLGRAIAAALFGDRTKLEIEVQSFKDSFANTANGVVDFSAMGLTQNLVRDASLGVDFSPSYLYTGQGVLVRDNSGISVLPTLNGRRVGILEGATSLQNLQDALSKYGGTFIPVKFATNDEIFAAYDKGEIDAVSTDLTILSARIPTLSNPAQHRILDEVLSKEPLGLITDENQSEWADVVRWVYNALVQAEEYGITSGNIEELITQNTDENPANNSNSEIRQFLGLEGNIGEALGLPNDFAVKAIEAVGNYGEMYERHFNSNVLRRDSNALAADFGLQYSLPFAVTTANNTVMGTEGNDLLNGNSGDNSLNGNQGNDTLYGGKGNDFLSGGKGNDILFGGKGSDTLNGDSGDDLLNGGKGNDILFGGKGNDTLNGGAGDDLLNGGKGGDTFVLTPGNGTDAIADFTIGEDLLGLAGGLKFEQLTITQGTGTQARDTLIRLASTGAVLASLADSSASSITPAMFTLN
ncbi:transporter substrate-binding domain-containing protein [Microcoleus sp. MON1_C1]|uniref:transporter substrate-binding domain-containing protein n=1 Tax=Microcoleus sp. MON1_C1 TaxID=2818827 RepID=UPI002FD24021